MLDLVAPALAAAESATTVSQATLDWSLLGHVIVNALATICALAYTFGVVNQKIRAIDKYMEKMRVDVNRMRELNQSTDQRIHAMAVTMAKIDARLDMFVSAAGETGACPYFKAQLLSKSETETDKK